MKFVKAGLFAAGFLFGTAGVKLLSSKDAKKVYVHATAATLRAKDSVMTTGAAIAKEIADITISSDDLFRIVTLRKISTALMKRIKSNYRFIVSFNTMLIILGVGGIIQPTTSALLHNMSTLGIGLKSMTNLLESPKECEEATADENELKAGIM